MKTIRHDCFWPVASFGTTQRNSRLLGRSGKPQRAGCVRTPARFSAAGSLRFYVAHSDSFSPLVNFRGDEFAELGRRVRKRLTASRSESCFEIGICESNADFLIEFFDYLNGCISRRTNTDPTARLAAGYTIGHNRILGQLGQPRPGGYRQRSPPAGLDDLD